MSDEQVRRIALFFLFSLMDERLALHAAHRTVADLKSSKASAENVSAANLIQTLWSQFQTHRKTLPRNRPHEVPTQAWRVLPDIDIQAWSKFQKDAADTEIIAVVLSLILGFTPVDIASGLGITLGTVRYRIGKGARMLGQHVEKLAAVGA